MLCSPSSGDGEAPRRRNLLESETFRSLLAEEEVALPEAASGPGSNHAAPPVDPLAAVGPLGRETIGSTRGSDPGYYNELMEQVLSPG